MRQVGTLGSEQHARRFEDYLLTKGIHSRIEREDGQWVVWIHEEDQVPTARDEFARFREQPDDAAYTAVSHRAATLRKADERKTKEVRRKVVDVRDRWNRPFGSRCPVTSLLLLGSAIVAFLTGFGQTGEDVVRALSIADYETVGNQVRWMRLSDVQSGEIWRLVTPIFLHFTLLHFAFNMFMLFQFGGMIETMRGPLRFALMVLVMAVVSNLAQYFARGPAFGGMSGVVYGLFGYAWMKSRFDPAAGILVPPSTVLILMVWFFLGAFNLIGGIANFAHGGGLVTGMVMGYAPKLWRDLVRK
jgi:GlpG protein